MPDKPRTIWVKAGGNGPVILPTPIQGVTKIEGEPIEVEFNRFIRGRLRAGDLVEVGGVGGEIREPLGDGETFTSDDRGPETHTASRTRGRKE